MTWVIVTITVIVVIYAAFTLACCYVASRADDMMDEIYRDLANKE